MAFQIRRLPFVNMVGSGLNTPLDSSLYEKVKKDADNIYSKNSAYKSGWIVKTYKSLGGKYSGDKPVNMGLDRWYKENWKDIGDKEYPVYRPTKRITKETPLIATEIDKNNLKKQIKLKQQYKGSKNLPPLKKLCLKTSSYHTSRSHSLVVLLVSRG